MNIGFYGKGGSGKTTISAMFALYLDNLDYRVALMDVDVNSHTAEVIGAKTDKNKELSLVDNQQHIYRYLAGKNIRVKESEFLNTTPPGRGSGVWSLDKNNELTSSYGQAFGKRSNVYTVGSYKSEKVGLGCHHGNQSVAENMISHIRLKEKDILVIDSVAGNDAFGTSLYLNDLLVYVVKPEREGIAVMNRFFKLAEKCNILDRVVVIGNYISMASQIDFLKNEVPKDALLGFMDINNSIIEKRLADKPLDASLLKLEDKQIFKKIIVRASDFAANGQIYRYQNIVDLHRKVAAESWVAGSYRVGLEDQIDDTYIRTIQ